MSSGGVSERQTRSLPSPLWGGSASEAIRGGGGAIVLGSHHPHPPPPPHKGEGSTPSMLLDLLHHPHHGLDLDRNIHRQRTHPDGRAGVAPSLAQHRDEQVGAAVHHLRLVAEA